MKSYMVDQLKSTEPLKKVMVNLWLMVPIGETLTRLTLTLHSKRVVSKMTSIEMQRTKSLITWLLISFVMKIQAIDLLLTKRRWKL